MFENIEQAGIPWDLGALRRRTEPKASSHFTPVVGTPVTLLLL